jgi:Putative Ig domain
MSRTLSLRTAALAVIVSFGVIGQGVLAETAGAVTSTKAELKNGQLRLEGHAFAGQFVVASSTTSSAGARADQNGLFKIAASNFTAPDCKVTVSDNRTPTATVTLAGCTPSVKPVPVTPAPPTGRCTITPQPAVSLVRGKSAVVFFQTTGCNTTFNSGATPTPVQWTVVAGSIPTGMTGPSFQGTTNGEIDGIPSVAGTYRFTLQVTDQIGATDQATVTVTVA